jgi:hypothetical protein
MNRVLFATKRKIKAKNRTIKNIRFKKNPVEGLGYFYGNTINHTQKP